jgi:hypothetical protein
VPTIHTIYICRSICSLSLPDYAGNWQKKKLREGINAYFGGVCANSVFSVFDQTMNQLLVWLTQLLYA